MSQPQPESQSQSQQSEVIDVERYWIRADQGPKVPFFDLTGDSDSDSQATVDIPVSQHLNKRARTDQGQFDHENSATNDEHTVPTSVTTTSTSAAAAAATTATSAPIETSKTGESADSVTISQAVAKAIAKANEAASMTGEIKLDVRCAICGEAPVHSETSQYCGKFACVSTKGPHW